MQQDASTDYEWAFGANEASAAGAITGLQIQDDAAVWCDGLFQSQIDPQTIKVTYASLNGFTGDRPWRTHAPIANVTPGSNIIIGQTGTTN